MCCGLFRGLFNFEAVESWNETLLCRKETFQEFAGFLFDVTVRRRTDDSRLSINTVTTYLSAVKEHVREKWPGNSVWNGHDSAKVAGKNRVTGGWFTQINFDLETKQNNRCIEQGDSITERTQPMGREATATCVEFLLSSNTPATFLPTRGNSQFFSCNIEKLGIAARRQKSCRRVRA